MIFGTTLGYVEQRNILYFLPVFHLHAADVRSLRVVYNSRNSSRCTLNVDSATLIQTSVSTSLLAFDSPRVVLSCQLSPIRKSHLLNPNQSSRLHISHCSGPPSPAPSKRCANTYRPISLSPLVIFARSRMPRCWSHPPLPPHIPHVYYVGRISPSAQHSAPAQSAARPPPRHSHSLHSWPPQSPRPATGRCTSRHGSRGSP